MLSILTPPSTCSAIGWPPAWVQASIRARASRSSQGAGDEALAAEAGVHRHEQHQVDLVHHVVHQRQRRGRVEHQSGLAALLADQRQRAVHVAAGLRVEADVVGAGLGEHGHQLVHRLDHEVHVDGHRHVRADRRTDHRADGQVGHVVVVHHVEVDPVGAGGDVAHSSPRRAKSADRMLGVMRVAFDMAFGVREGIMCHYCSLGREVGKSPCGGVRPRLSDKRAASASWNALAWRQEPPRVHHPHTGKDCETLRPQRLCLSALRSRTVRSGRAPVRVRLYRSHHQHRRTPGPGDQPPLDHHRRQPARAGSARAGRGRAAACWRPARPSNTPAAARCPPRWARCAAPIIASARTASRSRCRFRIRPGDAAYLALTPRGDCFSGP